MSAPQIMILAAGKGKRMKSELPKVLHEVGGLPLIVHAVKLAQTLHPQHVIIVVPREHEQIKNAVQKHVPGLKNCSFQIQNKQLGTAHAVRCGLRAIKAASGSVMVINGDMPLVSPKTLGNLVKEQKRSCSPVVITVSHLPKKTDPVLSGMRNCLFHFGRVVRNDQGRVVRIVEAKDASGRARTTNEINVGVYRFDLGFLKKFLNKISNRNRQKEYYLPDLITSAHAQSLPVGVVEVVESCEALGVNSCQDLCLVNEVFYARQRQRFLEKGVLIFGQEVFIDEGVHLAPGVVLQSPCYLKGRARIAKNVCIETGCVIHASRIQKGAVVKAHSYLEESVIGEGCQVGPFARLRPQTVLKGGARVGNFVETKKSRIGEGSKVNHLSYVGDSLIGRHVNVGAGTITCNYDGFKKHRTVLEDGVFVGSDTQLVAPVRVGKGAVIGAGTTVTEDVGANNLVISRVRQREIPGWAIKNRQKNNS